MAKIYLRKVQGGLLAPADDDAAEFLQKQKLGEPFSAEIVRPRNYKFHKKMFALYSVCFDHFVEHHDWNIQFRGMKIEPSRDLFRKQLTIMAGHYDATYDIKGNVRVEAKSISFASCSEEEFERIYSDTINAALKHVYKETMTEEQLRIVVDDILRFA